MANNFEAISAPQPTVISHLLELRSRIVFCLVAYSVIFIGLFCFAKEIYDLLAAPLIATLGDEQKLIATEITSPFMSPLKLVLFLALYLAMPVFLYHIWFYIAPGLYRHEKKLLLPMLILSCALFYSGILFCYFVVFPLVFGFFQSVAPKSVIIMPDVGQYLSFALKLFLAFGVVFQVPILVVLLVKTKVISAQQLANKRRHVILIAFILGMILTPPDVISQILLAVPVIILFELGLVLSKYLIKL